MAAVTIDKLKYRQAVSVGFLLITKLYPLRLVINKTPLKRKSLGDKINQVSLRMERTRTKMNIINSSIHTISNPILILFYFPHRLYVPNHLKALYM